LLLAGAVVAGIRLGLELVPPDFGEPLALRWLRSVAEHPIRATLALALLGVAFGAARPPERQAEARGGPTGRL
jgi:hypothetical protein